MNRRAFFSVIAAGLTAAADPERLLWVPRRRVISIPKRFGMSQLPPPGVLPDMWVFDTRVVSQNRIGPTFADVYEVTDRWEQYGSSVFLNGVLTPHKQIPIVEIDLKEAPWKTRSTS